MNINLEGKHALVCGASKGIGRAIAQQFAASGCRVTLLARTEEALARVKAELPGAGHSFIAADHSDIDQLLAQVAAAQQQSSFDILVNNSGGPPGGPITQASSTDFITAFQQHLLVNAELAKLCLPGMRDRGYGRIINIVSTSVKIPLAGLGVSNTVRGAVASWAKTLANEVASAGITVNCILPGATETQRLDEIIAGKSAKQSKSPDDVTRLMQAQIPAGRFGKAEEIGYLACFLASHLASYITGTAIPVDGGSHGEFMKVANYIGGTFSAAIDGETLPLIAPARGAEYGSLPRSKAADAAAAVVAAQSAFAGWSATAVSQRAELLRAVADLMARRADELAWAECVDTGKPIALVRAVDIPRSIQNFRFFAGAAEQFASESHHDNGMVNFTKRDPLGVVVCISPWNLPLYLLSWKIAPALATGNCVVAKPSEMTPATAYLLSEIFTEAGLPAGSVNIVHGLGAEVGASLAAEPAVAAISFTGGTQTGQSLAKQTAGSFKKLSLELGGKNPFIVLADADLQKTAEQAARAAFTNQGQICLCASRFLIHDDIADEFTAAFLRATARYRPANPEDPATKLGSVISKAHFAKILSYISLAKEAGGEILTGGTAAALTGALAEGYFIEPTIITGLANQCPVNQEEIFGPVVTIQRFQSVAAAIELANDTAYGLAASIWTSFRRTCLEFQRSAEVWDCLGQLLDAPRPAHTLWWSESFWNGPRGRLGSAALYDRA